MFGRKKQAVKIESEIEWIKKRIHKLECEHDHISFLTSSYGEYYSKCDICDKHMEWFKDAGGMKKAQLAYFDGRAAKLRAEIAS